MFRLYAFFSEVLLKSRQMQNHGFLGSVRIAFLQMCQDVSMIFGCSQRNLDVGG